MKTFVRLDGQTVVEIISPKTDSGGMEIPISVRFHPDFVAQLVDVSDRSPEPEDGWVTTDGGQTFAEPKPSVLTPTQIADQKVAVVQALLDAKARELRYDDIASASTYADEAAVAKFQQEGQSFREWRSLAWAKCYEILDAVTSGARGIPTDEELLAELPSLTLPAETGAAV